MPVQKDTVKLKINFESGLNLECLTAPEIEIKLDAKFEYEAAAAKHVKEMGALKDALTEKLREERTKFQEKVKKAEATLKKLAEGGGSRTAAETVLEQVNAGAYNSMRTKLPKSLETEATAEGSKVKTLPKFKVKTKTEVPAKEFSLNKAFLKELASSDQSTAKRVKAKGKIGPLSFNLLDGVPKPTWLVLPAKVAMRVEINYSFDSTDVVDMARLQGVCSDLADYYRPLIKKGIAQYDAELGKAVEKQDKELATDIIHAVNRQLELIEQSSADVAAKEVKKAIKEMKNRQVDLVVYRVEAVCDCVFGVIKIATAAKDLYDKPPGYNLVSPIITVCTSAAGIVGVIRTAINDVWDVRDRLISDLGDLEKKRLLHLKTFEEKSGKEVARDLFNKVKEAVMDDVGSAEKLLQAFGAKATALLNQSRKLGGVLAKLLELQSEAKSEGASALADQIAPMLETIPEMQEQFEVLEKEEDSFEKALATVKRDASQVVEFVKFVKEKKDLLDPVGALEAGAKNAIKLAQTIAKS